MRERGIEGRGRGREKRKREAKKKRQRLFLWLFSCSRLLLLGVQPRPSRAHRGWFLHFSTDECLRKSISAPSMQAKERQRKKKARYETRNGGKTNKRMLLSLSLSRLVSFRAASLSLSPLAFSPPIGHFSSRRVRLLALHPPASSLGHPRTTQHPLTLMTALGTRR